MDNFDEYDFSYVEIVELGSTIEEISEDILAELIIDELNCMENRIRGITQEQMVTDILYYVTKYCYFIYHFETIQAFEHCSTTKEAATRLLHTYFGLTNEKISEMIISSVSTYKKTNENN